MANTSLFKSAAPGKVPPNADTVNNAGGVAYDLGAEASLAQLACTGCFGQTFYVSAENQLTTIIDLASKCSPEFVAKVAIYARKSAFMKDMPAVLLAHLACRGPEGVALMRQTFPKVIDTVKMLRNFMQVIRSGKMGRKSFGAAPKKAILAWLASQSDAQLFRGSVGNDPSLADVIKMVHPTPATEERKALYGYFIGKDHDASKLPAEVQKYEAFKRGDRSSGTPDVPFELLTALELSTKDWAGILEKAGWHMTRMNLNTFQRHGVFADAAMVKLAATRLQDAEAIAKARVFPYQLLAAFLNASDDLPAQLKVALQLAMEKATENVPAFEAENIVVCPDVSGSMKSAITGSRPGSTSKVRCVDVAALVAATVLRRNTAARVIPFEMGVVPIRLNPLDSIPTIAQQIAAVGGGGTNCSAPLVTLNQSKAKVDLVIYVSDNESWIDSRRGSYWGGGGSTATMAEWEKIKARNPKAKMVCIDLTPNTTSQAPSRTDILNVGGFSDNVFEVIAAFVKSGSANHWVDLIRLGIETPDR